MTVDTQPGLRVYTPPGVRRVPVEAFGGTCRPSANPVGLHMGTNQTCPRDPERRAPGSPTQRCL